MLQDFNERGTLLSEDEYSTGLRVLFPQEYQGYPDDVLEHILYNRMERMSPIEAEGFFSSVGNFIKNKVAPVAISALPVVASTAGTALGGPLGGMAGKALGQAGSNAISGGTRKKGNPLVSNIVNGVYPTASGIYPGALQNVAHVSNLGAAGIANKVNTPIVPPQMSHSDPQKALTQLLGFLQSTPFLQTTLSSVATRNLGTELQIPSESGFVTRTSYLEMLESLKYLVENAIIETDNAGVSPHLHLESESDQDYYIESLIENVTAYENSLLPDYDSISYY
jgi:hypothetical protein